MKLPMHIIAPVACALLCTGLFLGILQWQVSRTTGLLIRTPVLPFSENVGDDTDSLALDPRDEALLRLRQGDLLALQGNWRGAETEYLKATEADGGLPALRKLARAQLQLRDIKGVRSTIQKLRRAGARSEDLILLESLIALRGGDLSKAEDMLEHSPDSPQKHYGLSLLNIVQGNHKQSQKELADVEQGWEPVLRSFARTLRAAYDEYALFPESPNIHLVTLLSRALAQVEECELALPLLAQVLQQEDDYRDAWIVQGYCEMMTDRPKQAIPSFERAYALDPEKPEVQYFLGRSFAATGDAENALTFLSYALKNGFEPQEEIRRLLAKIAMEAGRGEEALEHYAVLTGMESATLEDFGSAVSAALALGKKEEARLTAQEAVKRWPKSAASHDLAGWTALETGRRDEARIALERALQLDPNLASAKERMKQL